MIFETNTKTTRKHRSQAAFVGGRRAKQAIMGKITMSTDEKKELNVMETLLNDQSYHIEFNVFLTNHVKHAVIALNRLGASPQRIR